MNLENLLETNPAINLTISIKDLHDFGQSIVSKATKEVLERQNEKVYSREEVLEKFHICSATLWRWDKLKLINSKKIGNRRFYAESEIKQLMKEKGTEA